MSQVMRCVTSNAVCVPYTFSVNNKSFVYIVTVSASDIVSFHWAECMLQPSTYSSCFMMELCVITPPVLWWSCVWLLLFYDVAVCDYSSCFMMELCVITPPILWWSCVWLLLLFYHSCVWLLLFYDGAVCDYSSYFMMELCVITPPVLS